MSQSSESFNPSDVVYEQVTLDYASGMFKVATIGDEGPNALLEEEGELRDKDEEIQNLADVIGETHVDAVAEQAILTVNGYNRRNEADFRRALMKLGSREWIQALNAIFLREAYAFKAVYRGQTVGVALTCRYDKKFARASDNPSDRSEARVPVEQPSPDLADLDAVEQYATSEEKNREIMSQLCEQVNVHLDRYGVGNLWEFSGFGVKEKFRHRNIGRTLAEYAYSKVPVGCAILMEADPPKVSMYQRMGFALSKSTEGKSFSIRIKPEWDLDNGYQEFPIMVLEKSL